MDIAKARKYLSKAEDSDGEHRCRAKPGNCPKEKKAVQQGQPARDWRKELRDWFDHASLEQLRAFRDEYDEKPGFEEAMKIWSEAVEAISRREMTKANETANGGEYI